MSSESPYKIGVGPKILGRASFILGLLLFLLILFTIAGIHQGVASGDFDRVFLKPFREFAVNLEKAAQPLPTPTFSPLPTFSLSPTPTAKPVPIQYTQPAVSNCIRANIREGEFASNKCYSQQDYEDLQYYLGRYQSAKLDLSSAEGFMRIDCEAAKTFEVKKSDCEKDQQDKATAEAGVNKYRGIIQGIIAKGK